MGGVLIFVPQTRFREVDVTSFIHQLRGCQRWVLQVMLITCQFWKGTAGPAIGRWITVLTVLHILQIE